MKVHLVCMGGYDSCSHKGVFSSREGAIKKCIELIKKEQIFERETLERNLEDLDGLSPEFVWSEYKHYVEKLQKALDKGEFNEGGRKQRSSVD